MAHAVKIFTVLLALYAISVSSISTSNSNQNINSRVSRSDGPERIGRMLSTVPDYHSKQTVKVNNRQASTRRQKIHKLLKEPVRIVKFNENGMRVIVNEVKPTNQSKLKQTEVNIHDNVIIDKEAVNSSEFNSTSKFNSTKELVMAMINKDLLAANKSADKINESKETNEIDRNIIEEFDNIAAQSQEMKNKLELLVDHKDHTTSTTDAPKKSSQISLLDAHKISTFSLCNKKCYLSPNKNKATWEEAREFCGKLGMVLAKFDSEEDFRCFKTFLSFLPGDVEYWIGLRRASKTADYRWLADNSTLQFSKGWVEDYRLRSTVKGNCVYFTNSGWVQAPCEHDKKIFICHEI